MVSFPVSLVEQVLEPRKDTRKCERRIKRLICILFRTWPVNEQVIDIVHKAVFAFASGYLCDRWIQ